MSASQPAFSPLAPDTAAQLGLLEELREEPYRKLFAELRRDRTINTGLDGVSYLDRGLIHNGYFPTPDAELYAALLLRERPSRVIEVGSGYSTAVARRAIEHGGLTTEVHVIDPEPRISVKHLADRVERREVQVSSLVESPITPGSVLFIDSSHRVESGGDGPFLYCSLLPGLPPGVLVHVHDVFLPFEYPTVYREWGYAEQYLLQALLTGSDKFEIVFACYWMSHAHPAAVRETFGPEVADGHFRGASLWMRSRA